MKIALGCDHGGYDLKERIKTFLEGKGYTCEDFGTYSQEGCDSPVFGKAAAEAVADGRCDKGIVICTTGIGISITANKVKGIRCALCADSLSAEMTRRHNDANVIALGAGTASKRLFPRQGFIRRAFNVSDIRQYIDRVDEMIGRKNELFLRNL